MKQNDTLCSIATTLYPSYLERLTSPASNEFLGAHVKECPHCQKFLHISEDMHDSVTAAPMRPAVDTAANLSEASYLRRYRRLFFATVSGIFLGILLFALLLANMIYGANHLFKIAINQKTTRTESTADYGELESYAGISDFSIFPGNLSGCETVGDYYYRCDSSSFFTALQLYLDCTYTPENYEIISFESPKHGLQPTQRRTI